ncbi:hypothetical protein [Halalkalibacter flavus]|uniref:hypothetical protein n=1 Tax=Halalkalibacter flavus TaxID=3090668 RepID=UPI002FC7B27D
MEQNKFKGTSDIETLKKKLFVYKQTLESIKSENVVEDYLLTKNECIEIKKQVSTLEGEIQEMKENQDLQKSGYNKKIKNLSKQVESFNDSIQLLKQDVAFLMNKVNNPNFNDLINKIDKMIDIQNTSISLIQEGHIEMKGLKEEIAQSKKQDKNEKQLPVSDSPNPKQKHQPSGYKQLQNMLKHSNHIQPYLDEEKRAIPRRQNYAEKLHQQAVPIKGRQVKQGSINSNVPTHYQDLNKMNVSKNKVKQKFNKPSLSFNDQITNTLGSKYMHKTETQNIFQGNYAQNPSKLNRKNIPIETKKLTNKELKKNTTENKTVNPKSNQNENSEHK